MGPGMAAEMFYYDARPRAAYKQLVRLNCLHIHNGCECHQVHRTLAQQNKGDLALG